MVVVLRVFLRPHRGRGRPRASATSLRSVPYIFLGDPGLAENCFLCIGIMSFLFVASGKGNCVCDDGYSLVLRRCFAWVVGGWFRWCALLMRGGFARESYFSGVLDFLPIFSRKRPSHQVQSSVCLKILTSSSR